MRALATVETDDRVRTLPDDEGVPVWVPVGEAVLTKAEEDELSAALAEIRRGESVDGEALLRELRGSPRA